MEKIKNLKTFVEEHLYKFLRPSKELVYYIEYDEIAVNYGDENDCNIKYCEDHNIPCYQINRGAGCCVSVPGNINIAVVTKVSRNFIEWAFTDALLNYLKEKGLNVTKESNDILVDGFKVASSCGKCLGPEYKWIYTGIQISINQDIDLIKSVCTKEMKKVPKGLGEFGITTQEMIDFCNTFFNNLLQEK